MKDSREDKKAEEIEADSAVEEDCIGSKEHGKPTEKSAKNRKTILMIAAAAAAVCLIVFVVLRLSAKSKDSGDSAENQTGIITDEYVWSDEVDGATFFYEFTEDGCFTITVGTIEFQSHYDATEEDGMMKLGVDFGIGSFHSKNELGYADYTLSDSSDPAEQTLTCTYDDDTEFTLKKVKKSVVQLEPADDFSPDEALLGTWNAQQDSGSQQLLFNEDGTMVWSIRSDDAAAEGSAKYSGTYTFEDSSVIFTYYAAEETVVELHYTLNGDQLNILGSDFVREDAAA